MRSNLKQIILPTVAFLVFLTILLVGYFSIVDFLDKNLKHQRGNRHIIKINLLVQKGTAEALYALNINSIEKYTQAVDTVESALGYLSTIPVHAVGISPDTKVLISQLVEYMDELLYTKVTNNIPVTPKEQEHMHNLANSVHQLLASSDLFYYEKITNDSVIMRKHIILTMILIFILVFIILMMTIKLLSNLNKRTQLTIELQNAKKNLEKRVQERTAELKKMNDTLTEKVEEELRTRAVHEQIINEQKKLADMGQMINAIAHQWRQPLNVLGLLGQEIIDLIEEGQLDDKFLETFKETHYDMVEFLSSTIDDFRDFYKPDKNKEKFNVYTQIKNILKLLDIQFSSSKIRIETKCKCWNYNCEITNFTETEECNNKDVSVYGYPGEFKQVLINIFYNAKDAITDAIKSRSIDSGMIDVKVSASDNIVTISVMNNGGAIPEDIRSHIFEPYFTTKGDCKGTGLGLYMSKTVIEKHMNGKIKLDDKSDETVFVIELPLLPDSDSASS